MVRLLSGLAPAKINLFLRVVGRRPDGFHQLDSVFLPISVHDRIAIELRPARAASITLKCDRAGLPLDERNLAIRAARAFMNEFGVAAETSIDIHKEIPVGAGLGGGSSDAGAVLRMMAALYRIEAVERLLKLALALGADVPFFLLGGRAVGVSRGDEIYPLADAPRRAVLVVSPKGIGVSTKEAYEWLSPELTRLSKPNRIWRFCALCWSRSGEVSNDFEGPVFDRHPRLREIQDALLERGAAEAALAGSGSAVFGVFRNPAQARRAARAFPKDSVFLVKTVSRGEYGRAMGWKMPD